MYCSNTAKKKVRIERPKIATKVDVVSIQVFCFIAEIVPKMIPKNVPKMIACSPSCSEGPILPDNKFATGWALIERDPKVTFSKLVK